jgi:Kef-type K+ transport system membrane component KefB
VTFGTLALIVAVGLAGPLLASGRRSLVPVLVGELLAGVIVGRTGFRWINASESSLSFLADVGFAAVMMMAGTHVPLHDRRLVRALGRGTFAAALVVVLSIPLGIAIAHGFGLHHDGVWALLLATGSAAVVLPMLAEVPLPNAVELPLMAQVTVADIATIAAVPLLLDPSRAGRTALGGLAVCVAAVGLAWLTIMMGRTAWMAQMRRRSVKRDWGLDLRLSLLALFTLAWLANKVDTSVLVAGFAAGLIVATLGEPHRLIGQLVGVVNGFLAPLFFVVLGARLDLRAVVHRPSTIVLAVALLVGTAVVHVVGAVSTRQPAASGLVASAQLGVPAAVAAIGLEKTILTPAQGSAIMLAAVGTLGLAALGVALLDKRPKLG